MAVSHNRTQRSGSPARGAARTWLGLGLGLGVGVGVGLGLRLGLVVEERAHELRRRALQPRRALGATLLARERLQHVLRLRLVGPEIERGTQRLWSKKARPIRSESAA